MDTKLTFSAPASSAPADAEARGLDAPADGVEWLLRLAIALGLCGTLYALVSPAFAPLLLLYRTEGLTSVIARPSLLWALMGSILLIFRTILWFRYRPAPSVGFLEAPTMTVVIPAYNEGPMVARSILSVLSAHYPHDRLEIVAIDDGSADDTWEHIQHAAAQAPGRVQTVRFPRNKGKREGLAEGFRRARGELIVTIDSDSVIEPETLLAIAGPFRDARVGAVAGRVDVLNRDEGFIPRMLHVRFVLAFDLLRAVQSTFRTVYCCPGALAAYRTAVVRDALDEWRSQRFLGAPCTYGEDRALTNSILERGFDTLYQRSAMVRTVVPTTYAQLCKMYIRWDRSYVREELRFTRTVWKRPPLARTMAILDTTITNLRYPVAYATLALLVVLVLSDPTALVRVLLVIGVMALFNMLYFLRAERSWKFLYGVAYAYFAFFGLFWIFPYAAMTLRSRAWLTR